MKKCSNKNCIQPYKDEIFFNKSVREKDGLCSQCKQCQKDFRENPANKQRLKDRQKTYQSKPEVMEARKNYIKEYNLKPENKKQINALRKEKRKDPELRLKETLSKSMLRALKSKGLTKAGKKFLDTVNYTAQELLIHIESRWEDWMSWDNFGWYSSKRRTWQIDHIYPSNKLHFNSIEDDEFKFLNSLCNLRPLESALNVAKSDKLTQEAIDLFEKWKLDNLNKLS